MTNIYQATPYDISASGFYFKTYDEYLDQSAKHRSDYGDPVEEYEIQLVDGDNYRLFGALGVNQANLDTWFSDFEKLETDEAIKAIYLSEDLSYAIDAILDRLEDVSLFEGTALEYTESYIEDTGLLEQIPKNLRFYFDTEKFARDMVLGGDISSIEIDGTNYIIHAF